MILRRALDDDEVDAIIEGYHREVALGPKEGDIRSPD